MKYIKLSYSELAWIAHKLGDWDLLAHRGVRDVLNFLINKMPNGDIIQVDDSVFIQDSLSSDLVAG